ncbi:hypothetical protein GCM10011400_64740 [Paraburkholderia caffeinilytica]|uniref:Uncharacterized protein n=1 Tax=Paraburkholderia caffeinilytica TaxID=1761016 RepID=A0ABQ1NBT8_9BURK|nr:hypothetical protein GCM10011400_64740 [Paraburkholderia caffeinilytica]CAB3804476.1 hypothetical protein LMG28690_06033 [Paraburkholderia caffeinilytica]
MVDTGLWHSSQRQVVGIAHRKDQSCAAVALASSYVALLTSPLSSLVGSTLERADVASVAILGYN